MSTYAARKYGTDHDGWCDMRAEAEELARGEAHDRFYGAEDATTDETEDEDDE